MPEDHQGRRPRGRPQRRRPAPALHGQRPSRGAGTSVAARAGVGDKAGTGTKSAVKDIAKGAAKGAAGKSAEGKLAGGGLTGAVAGAAREAVHHANWKWPVAIRFIAFLPTLTLLGGVIAVGSLLGGVSGTTGESSAQSVESSTGVPQANLAPYQEAVADNETPWQVLAAIAYYESGRGEPVCSPPPLVRQLRARQRSGRLSDGSARRTSGAGVARPSRTSTCRPRRSRNGTIEADASTHSSLRPRGIGSTRLSAW